MSEETRQSILGSGSDHDSLDADYAPSPPKKRGVSLFKPPKKKGPTAGQAALAAVAEGVEVAAGGSRALADVGVDTAAGLALSQQIDSPLSPLCSLL